MRGCAVCHADHPGVTLYPRNFLSFGRPEVECIKELSASGEYRLGTVVWWWCGDGGGGFDGDGGGGGGVVTMVVVVVW